MDGEFRWSFPNAWYYPCFIAATAWCAVSGVFLATYHTPDFTRFFVLRMHVGAGLSDVVFAGLTLRAYITASDEIRKPRLWALPTVLMQILPQAQIPFKAIWALGLAAWGATSWRRGFRFSTLLFTVLFNSGLYIGGPFVLGLVYADSLRSDFFYWCHICAGATAIAWLPFALRRIGRRRAEFPRRKRAAMFAAAFAVFFVMPAALAARWAVKENKRFAYSPAKLEPGYGFYISPKPELRKPMRDPSPYIQKSKSCGVKGCHPDMYQQWLVSSHSAAASTPPYRKILGEFAARFGWESTAFCSRCHSPLTVVYGVPDKPGNPVADRLRAEGISCQFCHAIADSDPAAGNGNAGGRLYAPFPFPLKKKSRLDADYTYRYTIWNMRGHRRDYGKSALDRGQWCGSCHRVDVPHSFTAGHDLTLGDTWTPWMKTQGRGGLSCTDCHMPLTTYTSRIHARPDHRIWGINQAMGRLLPHGPKLRPLVKEFDKRTADWLQGRLPVPKYEVLYLGLSGHKKYRAYKRFLNRPATLGIALDAHRRGRAIEASAELRNNTLAHNFPASPLDLMETWVEVTARGADGKLLFRNCPPGGPPPGGGNDCLTLGGVPVDAAGKPIMKHYFWDARGVEDRKIIPPGGKLRFGVSFETPAGAKPPVTITARCIYRRYNQAINEWVYGPGSPPFPATVLSKTKTTVK